MPVADRAALRTAGDGTPDDLGERDFVDQAVEEWAREWPADDAVALALQSRLMRLTSFWERSVLEQLRVARLSRGEDFILTTLRRAGQPYVMTVGELARSILSTSKNISGALKRLEERKLLRRDLHPDDRRSIVVSLTEAGQRCVDDVRDARVKGADIFSKLTDEERLQLSALMKKGAAGVRRPAGHAERRGLSRDRTEGRMMRRPVTEAPRRVALGMGLMQDDISLAGRSIDRSRS